jgi:hypothetical protein
LIPGDREKKVKTVSLPAAQGELTGLLVNRFLIFAYLAVFLANTTGVRINYKTSRFKQKQTREKFAMHI